MLRPVVNFIMDFLSVHYCRLAEKEKEELEKRKNELRKRREELKMEADEIRREKEQIDKVSIDFSFIIFLSAVYTSRSSMDVHYHQLSLDRLRNSCRDYLSDQNLGS